MRYLSPTFRREVYKHGRNYLTFAKITLRDDDTNPTVLNLTNSEIWVGGFSFEDSVSEDESFTALGSVVIGSAALIINNIDESYSVYNFTNAKVELSIGMMIPSSLVEGEQILDKYDIGTYTVDDAVYNGATIRLSLLDYIEQFDRPYNDSSIQNKLNYPATLFQIVQDCCFKCGVTLDSLTFPHYDFTIQDRPTDDSITYREVLSWVATIAGCFVKCKANGHLELKWFDTTSLAQVLDGLDGGIFDVTTQSHYQSGDTADGGSFNPWNTGYVYDSGEFSTAIPVHYITSLNRQQICIDETYITGVSITVETDDPDDPDLIPYYAGQSDPVNEYTIQIAGNKLITKTNAQQIANWLWTQLNGVHFRKMSISHLDDLSIESGDVAIVEDRKGRQYPILVTRVSFTINGYQSIVCGSSTPSRNNSTRYTSATKSYVETKKLLRREQSLREQIEEEVEDLIENAQGLYYTEVEDTTTTPHAIIRYLHNKENLSDSDVQIMFSTAGIMVTANGPNPSANDWYGLTVNGDMLLNLLATTGLSFDWAYGGTLTLGGQNNQNGELRVLDASGQEIGRWNNNGISLIKGTINLGNGNFEVDTNGAVVAKNINATGGYIGELTLASGYLKYGTPVIPEVTDDELHVYVGKKGIGVDSKFTPTGYSWNCYRGVSLQDGSVIIRQKGYSGAAYDWHEVGYLGAGARENVQYRSDDVRLAYTDVSGNELSYIKLGGNISGMSFYSSAGFVFTDNHQYPKLTVNADLVVSNGYSKNKEVETEDYAERKLYCYETASPLFGDVGEGVIGEDGYCYVMIDPIFAETINLNQYQVFLQRYGQGDCYVLERKASYFIVAGTEGLKFGWEIKGKQADLSPQLRLERNTEPDIAGSEHDYAQEAINHIAEIQQERMPE